MKVFVDRSGRWSGGGAAVIRNLAMASRLHPETLTLAPLAGAIRLIPRNVPNGNVLALRPFILMPQNALPWAPLSGSIDEAWLALRLRAASRTSMRVARGVVRISEAIPQSGTASEVIHNVLDEAFEEEISSADRRIEVSESIISIGSLHQYRNFGRLIEAHQHYRRTGGRRDLAILASPGSASTAKRIRRLARRAVGIRVYEERHPRARVLRAIRDAAGVVLPSLVEASPITALESVSLSPSVVLSDLPGNRGILRGVRQGVEGESPDAGYFDPRNVDAIAAALHRLDSRPHQIRHDYLCQASNREQERVVWAARVARELTAILDQGTRPK